MVRHVPRQGMPGHGGCHHQRGQALIYGIFVLAGALAALFFLFNSGQLVSEKTKLVNTADAVAYSAGVMHARALNYLAYTNRALIANEIAVAQQVSLASWARYLDDHGKNTALLNCEHPYYSYPTARAMVKYSPLCTSLFYQYQGGVTAVEVESMESLGEGLIPAANVVKSALQASQAIMQADMPLARSRVMNEVAQANYSGDGSISVDALPLTDTYLLFDGKPFAQRYSGKDRKRFAEVTTTSAERDGFVKQRAWRDDSLIPSACIAIGRLRYDYIDRTGSTKLDNYDDWKANDKVTRNEYYIRFRSFSLPSCRKHEYGFGSGEQRATAWGYKGLPSFYDLSDKALAYKASASNPDKRDPKPQFVIRVVRSRSQTRTSDARSEIGASDTLNAYRGRPAGDTYAAVSGSEVFFQRPQQRADGQGELASLFNPYWQVHLVDTSSKALAAWALQGVAAP